MKKSKITIYALHLVCGLALVMGCAEDKKSLDPTQPAELPDQLSDQAVAVLDTSRRANLKLEELLLPNGQNLKAYLRAKDSSVFHLRRTNTQAFDPLDRKTYLIGVMLYQAWWLTQDRIYPAGPNPNEPLQTSGLGYVYGSKQILERKSTRELRRGTCEERLFGIDCSGFVSLAAGYQGAVRGLPDGANNQSDAGVWETALKSSYPELRDVKVKAMTEAECPPKDLEAGDLVFFKRIGSTAYTHNGIIGTGNNSVLAVLNSYGNPSEDCAHNYNYFATTPTYARPLIKKGPTQIALYGTKNIDNFLGTNAYTRKTLRIYATGADSVTIALADAPGSVSQFKITTIKQADPLTHSFSFGGAWKHYLLGAQDSQGNVITAGSLKGTIKIVVVIYNRTSGAKIREVQYNGSPIQVTEKDVDVICSPRDINSTQRYADGHIPAAHMSSVSGMPPMYVKRITTL